MKLQKEFIELEQVVRVAGEITLKYWRKDDLQVDYKDPTRDDGSPVTQADFAVDKLLKERLLNAFPGYAWLSEETQDDKARLNNSHVWIVDPIDGTSGFIKGSDTFTISAALVVDGIPEIGIVYAPARDELLAADGNQLIHTGKVQNWLGRVCLIGSTDQKKLNISEIAGFKIKQTSSTAYKFAQVAAGKANAFFTLSARAEWDMAAAVAIGRITGIKVSQHDGNELKFNQSSPETDNGIIVASTADDHARLITAVNENLLKRD